MNMITTPCVGIVLGIRKMIVSGFCILDFFLIFNELFFYYQSCNDIVTYKSISVKYLFFQQAGLGFFFLHSDFVASLSDTFHVKID